MAKFGMHEDPSKLPTYIFMYCSMYIKLGHGGKHFKLCLSTCTAELWS